MQSSKNINGSRIEVGRDWFTAANLVSMSRMVIPVPIIMVHQQMGDEARSLIAVMVAYIFVSDYLDGLIARKFNRITESGKLIDPVADKFCAIALFFYAVYLQLIPVWFFALVLLRDVLILAGSLVVKKERGKVAMSVIAGKVYVNALAVYWITAFFLPHQELLNTVILWLTFSLLVYSFAVYVRRFYLIQKGLEFN